MKRVKKPVFFIIAALILALTYTAVCGVYTQNGDTKNTWIKGVSDIRWGIDIRGGVEATFSPADGVDATSEQLESAKAIIELRMVSKSITDYEIYTDEANDKIIVRFPWKSGESDFDPEKAIEEISATALLTFREGMEYETQSVDESGNPIYQTPSGTTAESVILEGSDVVEAKPVMQQNSTTGEYEYAISLKLSDEGAEKFAEATERLKGQIISIWMDDIMISYPTVNSVITDGEASITGNFTASSASELAAKIQGGALPFALQTSNFSTVNPTLGLKSLDAMVMAGLIAFAVIAVFMIVAFRLPGFVAVLTLIGQIAITFAAISGYFPFVNSFTMTLPGIAGIILSIGVGVDANIITASRIKEELHTGKTLDGAIHKGCSNSLWSIIDGNITILIVALMLIGVFGPSNILSKIFGESTTGAIYSFGYTLLVGVIGNFVMGVFCSRMMIKSLSGFKPLRKKWLFGGADKK
ncbi:MAG: preprotein translocase subunit SecD [Hominenteromicrobium sp.]